jgi:hypothetical protein
MHYGPAIQRVLSIIQKGLKDRLTVNGEILRLHRDLSARMRDLNDVMDHLQDMLEPVSSRQNSRLRESISSIISADRSFSSATMAGTPGSSPASSIDFSTTQTSGKQTPKYGLNGYSKPRASSTTRPPLASANRRSSLLPQVRRPTTPSSTQSATHLSRRAMSPAPGPPSVYRQGLYAPPKNPAVRPAPTPLPDKPRWTSTVRASDSTLAPTYRSTSSPTPYRRAYTPRSISSTVALPLRSPLARESSSSPIPITAHRDNHYKSFAERVASPVHGRGAGGLLDPPPYHRSRNVSAPHPGTIRSPSSLAVSNGSKAPLSAIPAPRPPSSLSRSPRQSLSTRMSSLNARLEPRSSMDEPTLPEFDPDQERRSDVLDEENDQLLSDPSSSPLSRKTATRPGSVMGSARGKRMSMLPVPVGGRTSSLGSRA